MVITQKTSGTKIEKVHTQRAGLSKRTTATQAAGDTDGRTLYVLSRKRGEGGREGGKEVPLPQGILIVLSRDFFLSRKFKSTKVSVFIPFLKLEICIRSIPS